MEFKPEQSRLLQQQPPLHLQPMQKHKQEYKQQEQVQEPAKGARRRAAVASMVARVFLVIIAPLLYALIVGLRQQSEPSLRTGVGGVLFCEAQRSADVCFFCQPASGLSALSYLLLPLCIATTCTSWGKDGACAVALPWTRLSAENLLIALANVYLCVGNLAMHGFCTEDGHFLDATSMNVCVAFFLAFVAGRLLRRPAAACFPAGREEEQQQQRLRNKNISERVVFFSVLSAACAWVFFAPANNEFAIFGSIFPSLKADRFFNLMVDLIGITLFVEVAEVLAYRQTRNWAVLVWHVLTVASFAIGYALWGLGENAESAVCHPSSFFQPHGLWHLATAGAIYFFWRRMQCGDVGPGSPSFSAWFAGEGGRGGCCGRCSSEVVENAPPLAHWESRVSVQSTN